MKIGTYHIIMALMLAVLFASCATSPPRQFPIKYYKENEATILQIEKQYNKLFRNKPIAAEFSDNDFKYITIEMKTDSLRYIYEFNLTEKRLGDTLHKYGYDTMAVLKLIKDMQAIKCTWINSMDYYLDDGKQSLTFMSIRPKQLDLPFAEKRYYILTFYKQPQYYDTEGRLLDKRNRRRLRKVNNEVFWRINDRVCYTLSDKFR